MAIKIIILSDELETEEAYESACSAAVTEASMMAMAEQGIDSQDLMVKLYGVCKGALPAHLTKFGFSEGEKHVGLVMRYEAGGALHALLHPDKKSPRVPLSLADQLRYMKDIAACLADLHVFGEIFIHYYFIFRKTIQ